MARVLEASRERILARLSDSDRLLDVGGWAQPLARADHVIDLMPYATRGMYGEPPDPAAERFDADSWTERDICDREPWPFDDDEFDFVVCAHTLEDVRDPVWVCDEMVRVARAGYVETPSRLEEQTWGVQGPWAGWSHHHWLVDEVDGGLEFALKPHSLHALPEVQIARSAHRAMSAEERIVQLWWSGGFERRERIFYEASELRSYLASVVDDMNRRDASGGAINGLRRRARRLVGR